MSILVTGAAGFIGSNFLQYKLEKDTKSNIIALDKLTYAGNIDNIQHLINQYENQLKFIIGDINDSNLIEKLFNDNEIDAVINFAAETHVDRSIVNPHTFLDTNVLGTHTLLNIAKKFCLQDSNSKRNK